MKTAFRGVRNRDYAKDWQYAMVSGNGRQGTMVFGNPANETIIGNHIALYLPQGNDYQIPNMAPYLSEFRELIKNEGYEIANKWYYEKALESGYAGLQFSDPSFPGFHLNVKTAIGATTDYKRYTNFENGEIGVKFTDETGIRHFRKTFVSRADDLIIHEITNNKAKVDCSISLDKYETELLDASHTVTSSGIRVSTKYVHGTESGYEVSISVVAPNAQIKVENDEICISNAENVLILMRINPYETAKEKADINVDFSTFKQNYDELMTRHSSLHSEIFNRVSLNLTNELDREMFAEDLIVQAKNDKKLPPALIEKMYDTGRYMLMCSAGDLIPNLQGIWTGTFNPPWSGDYTFDTNVQLSIASALYSGYDEGIMGLVNVLKKFLPEFRENAMKYFGCRGIFSSIHSSNSGLHVHWNEEWPLILWTCGAGWLGHWLYDYYLHTGDKEFLLREVIPYLKECALFYEDFLIADGNVTRFTPSYSAENGCGDNATQDIAVAKEVLKNLIEAHKELEIVDEQLPKWEKMLATLPPYMINDEGAIKEWAIPEKGENYNHRHFSQLYSIFQSREFDKESEPELWQASIIALEKRLEAWMRSADGDTTSSHGRMHAALCATRLNIPEVANEALEMMVLDDSMYPTLMTSHYNNFNLFNVDANGAIPQIINEMLLYGEVGKITLLGALPNNYPPGEIKGISLPKEIIINSLKWDLQARNVELTLASKIDQTIEIKMPLFGPQKTVELAKGITQSLNFAW